MDVEVGELSSEWVSRRHARLEITAEGRWLLEDVGSLAGTWIKPGGSEGQEVPRPLPLPPGVKGELFKDDILSLGTPSGGPGSFQARPSGPTRERPDLPRWEQRYMEAVVDELQKRYKAAAAAALQADPAAVHKEANAAIRGLKQATKARSDGQRNTIKKASRQKRKRAQAERKDQRRANHRPADQGKRKRQRR
jgi:hypothetical protein